MFLSNTTSFHPVHALGTYGYITLLFFKEKHTFMLKKKNVKNISWEKYVQARAFWRNGSYAPDDKTKVADIQMSITHDEARNFFISHLHIKRIQFCSLVYL